MVLYDQQQNALDLSTDKRYYLPSVIEGRIFSLLSLLVLVSNIKPLSNKMLDKLPKVRRITLGLIEIDPVLLVKF